MTCDPEADAAYIYVADGMGCRQDRRLLVEEEVLLSADDRLGPGSTAFNRRGLVPLAVVSVVLLIGGLTMTVNEAVLFGVPLPPPVRVGTGLLAVLLGAWFGRAVLTRAFSSEPAVELRDGLIHLHVTPGRAIVLRPDQVRGVGPVEPAHTAARRCLLGKESFEVRTTLPEGVRASSVVVGSRYVVGSLSAARDQLVHALR